MVSWAIPIDHPTAVDRFIKSWPTPLGPSGPLDRAPLNSHVLAFAHSLRDPIGAFFEPDRFLDEIAWASLGYYRPGDRFRIDTDWMTAPYDNPVSLEIMLRGWSARQRRTWRIASPSSPIMQLDHDAIRKEALFWWERLKTERAAGREPYPPGYDATAQSAKSLEPRRASAPVFWLALTGFVLAGLGAAVYVARRR